MARFVEFSVAESKVALHVNPDHVICVQPDVTRGANTIIHFANGEKVEVEGECAEVIKKLTS